jgi:hypothetical protein
VAAVFRCSSCWVLVASRYAGCDVCAFKPRLCWDTNTRLSYKSGPSPGAGVVRCVVSCRASTAVWICGEVGVVGVVGVVVVVVAVGGRCCRRMAGGGALVWLPY